jgi:hypothetical protein
MTYVVIKRMDDHKNGFVSIGDESKDEPDLVRIYNNEDGAQAVCDKLNSIRHQTIKEIATFVAGKLLSNLAKGNKVTASNLQKVLEKLERMNRGEA